MPKNDMAKPTNVKRKKPKIQTWLEHFWPKELFISKINCPQTTIIISLQAKLLRSSVKTERKTKVAVSWKTVN